MLSVLWRGPHVKQLMLVANNQQGTVVVSESGTEAFLSCLAMTMAFADNLRQILNPNDPVKPCPDF